MKYYSEMLKKLYDSETDLRDAEATQKALDEEKRIAMKKKEEERKEKAAEKERRWKEVEDAASYAGELYEKFRKDYGYEHSFFGNLLGW